MKIGECLVLVVLALVALACGDSAPGGGAERGPCRSDGTCSDGLDCHSNVCVRISADASASDTIPQPAKQPDEKSARAFFDSWLDAQNRGDFAAYAALYSTEFTGVRRTGPKKQHFDRDGWLVDRKRMFKPSMKVRALDPTFELGQKHVRILFVQEFSAKGFKDKGKKQLVLIRGWGHWKISREDMIESDFQDRSMCDMDTDPSCTGDDAFYSNHDWDAYSDGEGGTAYVAGEISRRYQNDIVRCRAGMKGAGKLRGVIVKGGWLYKPKVSGLEPEAASCIEQIAGTSWLFADPRENAWNDYTPDSVRKGFLAFEVSLP